MSFCRQAFLALSLCVLSLNVPLTAQSTGKCGFQTLNIPAPTGSITRPSDLSDTGAIVGLLEQGTGANFHTTGFLFSGGKFTHFRFPGSTDTFPADINKSGEIVGTFKRPDGTLGSFMVKSGVFSQVKLPGFPNAATIVTGVNDLGDIVGFFDHNNSTAGFLVHQGKLTIISFPGADLGTSPSSVNNEGVVIGSYLATNSGGGQIGFMWKNGNFTNIQFPEAAGTGPAKVNDKGVIVGSYEDTVGFGHGFSFINGTYTTIDRNTTNTILFGLNNFNNIVGVTENEKGDVWFKGFCSSQF
jgi:hypothetical protein